MKDKNKSKDEDLDLDNFIKYPNFIEHECLKCGTRYYLINDAKKTKCECGCYLDEYLKEINKDSEDIFKHIDKAIQKLNKIKKDSKKK